MLGQQQQATEMTKLFVGGRRGVAKSSDSTGPPFEIFLHRHQVDRAPEVFNNRQWILQTNLNSSYKDLEGIWNFVGRFGSRAEATHNLIINSEEGGEEETPMMSM